MFSPTEKGMWLSRILNVDLEKNQLRIFILGLGSFLLDATEEDAKELYKQVGEHMDIAAQLDHSRKENGVLLGYELIP